MDQEYYIGQIFEGSYPPDAAVWCNRNKAFIQKIEPVEKEIEETYTDTESIEREVSVEGSEDTEIIVEEIPVEKTRTIIKALNRYEIKEVPAPSEEEIKQQRIAELKAELDSTDYKIIKCSECSLAGVELPYDIVELHAQRQAIRDEINELEG